ncbi:amino acid ABC transporter substrate-binding protein [Brenneria goodwinii]|nr:MULTISPECIES: transporter substrate-binding domain-containing protein [Brenneria]ATA24571.1 amino acid ABC transporter substrate-binding protein [Brenneria goodwinii]PWC23088.1 amino acid ABC transporter substrate-binding protein [Brenneria roseae subsp. roseae]RLM20201.1 amino acid ABC transporter substrate-binding protein [Brenneria goodwinii]
MKFFASRLMSALLLIPGIFLTQAPAQAEDNINAILPDHVVRVGAVNAPPWYQKDLLTNQWTGLVPDVVQAIFKDTDIKIEYVDTQWGTAVAGLQSNRFDILGGFNNTPERAKAVDFTRPMGSHQMGVLTLEKDAKKYEAWATINNPQTRLAAIDGSAAVTLLQPQLDKAQWIIVPDSDNMQLQMESGRADAIVTNDIQMSQYIQKRHQGTMIIPQPVKEQATNMGLRKDRPQLQAWLDGRLEQLDKDGTLKNIWHKYTHPANHP